MKHTLTIFLLFLFSSFAHAQLPEMDDRSPIISLSIDSTSVKAGDSFLVGYKVIHPANHWSYYNGSSGGGIPHNLSIPEVKGLTFSKPYFPTPHIKWKESAGLNSINFIYPNDLTIIYKVTVAADAKAQALKLTLGSNFQMCDPKSCTIPQNFEASTTIKIGDATERDSNSELGKLLASYPSISDDIEVTASSNGSSTAFIFNTNIDLTQVDKLLLVDRDGFISALKSQQFIKTDTGYSLEVGHAKDWDDNYVAAPKVFVGILTTEKGSFNGGPGVLITTPISASKTSNTPNPEDNGGVTADATTPIGETKTKMGLFLILLSLFGGGIILNLMPCVFPVIGLKIMGFVQQSGSDKSKIKMHGIVFTAGVLLTFLVLALIMLPVRELKGNGAQLQNPWVVFILMLVMLVMGLSMFGLFEIGAKITGTGSKLQQKSGLVGTFFSGILAVVVATPCSAPLIGPAIGAAWKLPPTLFVISLLTMGLGLSLPYIVLSFMPSLIKKLPQPGAWMESFKQGMSFLLVAAAGYLLWVYNGLVDDGGQKGLAIILGITMISAAAWVYGRWVLPYKSSKARWLGRIFTLLLGVTGFIMAKPIAAKSDDAVPDFVWEKWSPEKVEDYNNKGVTVYVDFTARWCATCQSNKKLAYTDEVRQLFFDKKIIVMKADITREDPRVMPVIQKLGRAAIPVNVLYVPGDDTPNVTSEILTAGYMLDFVKEHLPEAK